MQKILEFVDSVNILLPFSCWRYSCHSIWTAPGLGEAKVKPCLCSQRTPSTMDCSCWVGRGIKGVRVCGPAMAVYGCHLYPCQPCACTVAGWMPQSQKMQKTGNMCIPWPVPTANLWGMARDYMAYEPRRLSGRSTALSRGEGAGILVLWLQDLRKETGSIENGMALPI